ncbi:MAG: hypothetical protein ACMXX7_02375 [Candidatus Woesearchaeota archaeon]
MKLKSKHYKFIGIFLIILGVAPYIGLGFSGIIRNIIDVLLIVLGVLLIIK